MFYGYAIILALAFAQNVAFSLVSRSRNRDNMAYHAICAVASNGVYLLTFKELLLHDFSYDVFPFYILGTVSGSLFGVKVAMVIERALGATSDGHIHKK